MTLPYESALAFFFSHALLTHIILLGGDVLATIAVGWGILWEAPSQPAWRHSIATWLVIGGVAVETLCSISLFSFDESISRSQQAKIIRLEKHLSAVLGSLCIEDDPIHEDDPEACGGDAFK
jgi:hypothetical protein